MKFNTSAFLRDYRIEIAPPGHQHCTPGRVQVHCPFCFGKKNFHLGIHYSNGRIDCWRCGNHKVLDTIQGLLQCPPNEARQLLGKYSTGPIEEPSSLSPKKSKSNITEFSLPAGTGPMEYRHKNYLLNRIFDFEKLETLWKLQGTGPYGDYKFRIIIPIFQDEKLVSYQGRDITDRAKLRYKACPRDKELIHHKHCLYGLDNIPRTTVVVCEGVTDVWRLGPGAVATFGITWTKQQLTRLRKFEQIFIFYDSGKAAQIQAQKMANELSMLNKTVTIVDDPDLDDPASLSQKKADRIMEKFLNA